MSIALLLRAVADAIVLPPVGIPILLLFLLDVLRVFFQKPQATGPDKAPDLNASIPWGGARQGLTSHEGGKARRGFTGFVP